jgi:hypothetical protein
MTEAMDVTTTLPVLVQYPAIFYMLSVVFATWIILYVFVGFTTDKQRIGVTACVGIVLGVVWVIFVKGVQIDLLILSFLASTGFYTYIIKQVMHFAGMNYNQYAGIFSRKKKRCREIKTAPDG